MTADDVLKITTTLPVGELERLHGLIGEVIERVSRPQEIDEDTKLALHYRNEILRKGILKRPKIVYRKKKIREQG